MTNLVISDTSASSTKPRRLSMTQLQQTLREYLCLKPSSLDKVREMLFEITPLDITMQSSSSSSMASTMISSCPFPQGCEDVFERCWHLIQALSRTYNGQTATMSVKKKTKTTKTTMIDDERLMRLSVHASHFFSLSSILSSLSVWVHTLPGRLLSFRESSNLNLHEPLVLHAFRQCVDVLNTPFTFTNSSTTTTTSATASSSLAATHSFMPTDVLMWFLDVLASSRKELLNSPSPLPSPSPSSSYRDVWWIHYAVHLCTVQICSLMLPSSSSSLSWHHANTLHVRSRAEIHSFYYYKHEHGSINHCCPDQNEC